MRRDPLPLVLLLVLVLLGSLAWLTRDPEHPLLERMTEWPVVGPAAEWFRQAYGPAPGGAGGGGGEPEVEVVVLGREIVDSSPPGRRSWPPQRVWVRAGTELLEAPDPQSRVVASLPGIRTMQVVERRGPWRRVSSLGIQGARIEGWVRQNVLGEPSAEELWRPEPVVPLPATPAAAEVLEVARELMGEDAREAPCAPYRLLTDLESPLVDHCPRLAGQLDRLFAARTGLEPLGEPQETILLFASEGAFLVFRTMISPQSRRHAFAAPARGFVALAAGERPPAQIRQTLVHELVHLLNRRFLGPALPPWLDEGLAEELAMSHIDETGALTAASLGRWAFGTGKVRSFGGGEIQLRSLQASLRGGELPTLESLVLLDRAAFQAEESQQTHYALSAFWVRYLFADQPRSGGGGFRDFLAAVAAGRPLDEGLLLGSLDADWPQLEAGFRGWLEAHQPTRLARGNG